MTEDKRSQQSGAVKMFQPRTSSSQLSLPCLPPNPSPDRSLSRSAGVPAHSLTHVLNVSTLTSHVSARVSASLCYSSVRLPACAPSQVDPSLSSPVRSFSQRSVGSSLSVIISQSDLLSDRSFPSTQTDPSLLPALILHFPRQILVPSCPT